MQRSWQEGGERKTHLSFAVLVVLETLTTENRIEVHLLLAVLSSLLLLLLLLHAIPLLVALLLATLDLLVLGKNTLVAARVGPRQCVVQHAKEGKTNRLTSRPFFFSANDLRLFLASIWFESPPFLRNSFVRLVVFALAISTS